MSSRITTDNIDGTYPIAGQDNDSQGFRDNFTRIKDNFAFARSEINDLLSKVVVKSALSGEGETNNIMNGTLINGALLTNTAEFRKSITHTSSTFDLNMANGNYQSVTLTGPGIITFSGWPTAGQIGKIRLEIVIISTAYTLTLPSAVTKGLTYIKGIFVNTEQKRVLTFDATGTYQFEFTTDDFGESITMYDLTRGRISAISGNPTPMGAEGDIAGMMRFTSTDGSTVPRLYVCLGNYDGSSIIWYKAILSPDV